MNEFQWPLQGQQRGYDSIDPRTSELYGNVIWWYAIKTQTLGLEFVGGEVKFQRHKSLLKIYSQYFFWT